MFMRQLMIAAFVVAVSACAGCSCCHRRAASYPPPCGCGPAVPAGPAVAVPAAPAPVSAGFAAAAPCPTCVGH